MPSAFRPQAIHELRPKDKSKIESLLAYGDRLLVGLNTGSLRIYRVNETSPVPSEKATDNGIAQPTSQASTAQARAVELLREEEKFSRKPVQQLAMVKEANLLVSLSDGYVSLHDLQTYQLSERIERSKGASGFSVTSNVVKDPETDVPSLVSRLAVGVKRKVMVWTWRDMELEEQVMELNVEGTAKALHWVHAEQQRSGDGAKETAVRLVVGMDPGFVFVDIETLEQTAVSKPASRQDTTSGELAGVRFGAVSSSGMGYMGMSSWVPKPMITGLATSAGHVLLAKDVNTLFTDISGKAVEKRQIPWSSAPEAVGYSYPYLLALQPPEKGQLQIRNPDTLTLLQTLSVPGANVLHVPQPNISLAHAGKGFLVASDRTIWRMNALPYASQLAELVEKQRFDEAISLLNLLEDTLIDDKQGQIREIKIQKACHLFAQQKYRPALDLFVEAEAPPERVVSLYPRCIAGDLSTVPDASGSEQSEGEHGLEGEEAEKQVSSGDKEVPTTPQKGMLASLKKSQTRQDSDAGTIKAGVARMDTDNMSIRTAKGTPAKNEKPADKPLEGEDLKNAVRCLYTFLTQARGVQIPKFLNTDGTLKINPLSTGTPSDERPPFANLLPERVFTEAAEQNNPINWQAELLATAKLVDTTLFRAYMHASPSLAGPLFRLDNFCDPDVVQTSLYEHNRYGDLIDFLHGKKLHREALELLTRFGKGEDDEAGTDAGSEEREREHEVPEGMRGPDRTVEYLKQLPPELVELVLEFIEWPLRTDPGKAVEVFVEDSWNAENLPRERVAKFLAERDERLEELYLEHIVSEWGDPRGEFHQRLVEIYLSRLKGSGPTSSSRDETEASEEDKEQLKSKLEKFLRRSKTYHKAQTFRQMPQDDPRLYESRAIVLSAMGNHRQALAIYVFQLQDYRKAEEYCQRIYLSEQAEQAEQCLLTGNQSAHQHEKPFRKFQPTEPDSTAEKGKNIFAILLSLYLRPPHDEEKRWPQALDLLSRHGARLPASSTLDLMPDDLAVKELQPYFLGRIRHTTSALRQEQVVKALSSVQRANADRRLLLGDDKLAEIGERGVKGGRNRRVRITEEDLCRVCHKRFGASAVRVFPDDGVVHYGCAGGRQGVAGGGMGGGRRISSGGKGWR